MLELIIGLVFGAGLTGLILRQKKILPLDRENRELVRYTDDLKKLLSERSGKITGYRQVIDRQINQIVALQEENSGIIRPRKKSSPKGDHQIA